MDDFNSIDDYKKLDLWIEDKIKEYFKIKKNTKIFNETIFPDGILHHAIDKKSKYALLKNKIEEIDRNCQIILRKISIYENMLENDKNTFSMIKSHCQDIYELHKIYVKTWNNSASDIKEATKIIKNQDKNEF